MVEILVGVLVETELLSSMNNGRIAYFEDNLILAASIQDTVDIYSDGRHQVVVHAADLSGSLAVLDQIAAGEIDANIVLSDGNLSNSVGGHDARVIMERVRELGLGVRTVLLSSQTSEDTGVSVDVAILKADMNGDKLVEILDGLADIES